MHKYTDTMHGYRNPSAAGDTRKWNQGQYTMNDTGKNGASANYRVIENGAKGFLTKRSAGKLAEYEGGVKLLETDGQDVYEKNKRHRLGAIYARANFHA